MLCRNGACIWFVFVISDYMVAKMASTSEIDDILTSSTDRPGFILMIITVGRNVPAASHFHHLIYLSLYSLAYFIRLCNKLHGLALRDRPRACKIPIIDHRYLISTTYTNCNYLISTTTLFQIYT